MNKTTTSIAALIAALLGGGSLLLFALFLFRGSLNLTDLGLDPGGILWLDGALSLLFFIQHSGMVRKSFRRRLAAFVPDEYHGAVYSAVSGIVLLTVIVLWQKGAPLFTARPGFIHGACRALFLLSLAGFLWGGLSLKSIFDIGNGPLQARPRDARSEEVSFSVRGPYGLVRHPLYFFTILMIWSSPDLTTDRLLFNILWTVWVVAGALLEERDLVAEFGEAYREYQRQVPMFIPSVRRKRRHDSSMC